MCVQPLLFIYRPADFASPPTLDDSICGGKIHAVTIFGIESPIGLAVTAIALLTTSFAWALVARAALAGPWRRRATGEMVAGLALCGPLLTLALIQPVVAVPGDVAPIGAGTAVTYLLLAPGLLLGRSSPDAWVPWRRAILPFLLAACVMWLLVAAIGRFTWLEGQFLITLFMLGTWLFTIERGAADTTLRGFSRPRALLAAGIGLAALGTGYTAAIRLVGWVAAPGSWWLPLFGSLACVGPLAVARMSSKEPSGPWLCALGYAAMVAFCLAPGVAVFAPVAANSLMLDLSTAPLYTGDAAFTAMTAAFLLGLEKEAMQPGRPLRWVLLGGWLVWICWIVLGGITGW